MRKLILLVLLACGCQTTAPNQPKPDREMELSVDVPPADIKRSNINITVRTKF